VSALHVDRSHEQKSGWHLLAPAASVNGAVRLQLPVASAVEPASTVKSTAAMECAAARRYTVEAAAKSTPDGTAETRAPVEAGARPEAATVEAVEPGARADKDPSGKVAGAIVSVRGTGIRSVPVVAIRAYRSRTGVDRSNPNRDLCIGSTGHHYEKSYQSHIL